MTEPDPVTERIFQAMVLDRAEGRRLYQELWSELDESDAYHRCLVAHYLADVQDDLQEELAWDVRALAEADAVPHGLVAGFYPSLHVNLAEDYRKLGEPDRAREHLASATGVAHLLPDGGYGDLIRTAIDRLAAELAVR